MSDNQFWTLISLISAGFGFVLLWLKSIYNSVHDIDKRVTIIETILSMIGSPIKMSLKNKEEG